MVGIVLRRLAGGVLALLALTAVVFVVFYTLPGDPAQMVCGPRACPADQLTQIRHALGLDESVPRQYWNFLRGLVAGRDFPAGPVVNHCPAPCLGYSFQTDEPVTAMLLERLPVSLSLAGGGFVLWVLIGCGLGVLAALHRGHTIDRLTTVLIFAGYSVPVFVTAMVLMMVFCTYLRWLPFPSYVPFTTDPLSWAQNLLLPWTALVLAGSSTYARLSRNGMLETLTEDHIRTARAYGLSERRVLVVHALRGALAPIVTVAALDIGVSLGGVVVTENAFGFGGLGQLLVQSVTNLDLPVLVGLLLLTGLLIVFFNLIADLLYVVIDRRARPA